MAMASGQAKDKCIHIHCLCRIPSACWLTRESFAWLVGHVIPQLTQCSIYRAPWHPRTQLPSTKALHRALPKSKGRPLQAIPHFSEAIWLAVHSSEEPGKILQKEHSPESKRAHGRENLISLCLNRRMAGALPWFYSTDKKGCSCRTYHIRASNVNTVFSGSNLVNLPAPALFRMFLKSTLSFVVLEAFLPFALFFPCPTLSITSVKWPGILLFIINTTQKILI